MAKQENPIIEEQVSWMGGPTNDEYAGPANSFWDSKNVSLRKNSREVTLAPVAVASYYAVPGIPVAHYGVGTAQVTFCSNGYAAWTTGDCGSTVAGNIGNIRNVVQYGYDGTDPNILMLSTTGISVWKYVGGATSSIVYNKWTFNNTTNNRPYLIFKSWLLLGDGNKVVKITWDGSAYAPASGALSGANIILNLKNSNETILKMFELGDQVVIFTDRGQYFWDGFNLEYDRFVPRDEPIVNASQYKTYFYVITQSYNLLTLWKTSTGYDRIPIQKDDIYSVRPRLTHTATYDNTMINVAGISYFVGATNSTINSYGAYNPGMTEVLEKQLYSATQYNTTSLYDGGNGYLYFGYYTGTSYYVGYINRLANATYTTMDALIRQKPIIGGGKSQDKEMVKYRFGYTLGVNNCIALYSKLEDETDRFTFLCNTPTVSPTVGATYTNNSSTFTVVSVSNIVYGRTFINTRRTTGTTDPTYGGNLTKATGTGDATISFYSSTDGRLVSVLDGGVTEINTKHKYAGMYNDIFSKCQLGIGLYTFSSASTPKLNDFYREYNQINNDL